jgi:hypothetical protein
VRKLAPLHSAALLGILAGVIGFLQAPLSAVLDCLLWQYGLWSFQAGDTKLERFLHKNQHTQRKLLNFEFWINGQWQAVKNRTSF